MKASFEEAKPTCPPLISIKKFEAGCCISPAEGDRVKVKARLSLDFPRKIKLVVSSARQADDKLRIRRRFVDFEAPAVGLNDFLG